MHLQRSGIEVLDVEDPNWREDARGRPGEEAQVLLQLRVVADAGFVGLPNAGKSSLLARMTAARPKVASYPFTTLMPNLGVLAVGLSNTGTEESAVLVDLPGLIEGAHKGRGLGRTFLRHLARTRMFVHVIDAAVDNPAADFWVVREELRLYNPQYCQRPCIVALNKMDLPDPQDLQVRLCSALAVL
jgi:Obg family GTPase CgtA